MALTGFLQNNVCYSTSPDAVNAYFSAIHPVITASGTFTIRTEFLQLVGVWNLRNTTTNNLTGASTTTTYIAIAPVFPSCDPMLGFTDGIALSVLIVGALVVAVSGGLIARAKK